MRTVSFLLFVLGFVAANAWSSILFKFAAECSGKKAVWYYIIGNLIGALTPLALTFALKRGHANVVYALCYGGGFTVIQIAAALLFHQPLSPFQWAGVVAVGFGICLLQFGQR